jgi:tetratricopeptide (TPR) repeat protein
MDVEPGGGYAAASAAYEFFLQAGDVPSALKVAGWPLFVWYERRNEIQALCERAVGLAAAGSVEDTRIRWMAGWMDYIRSGDYPAACRIFEQTQAAAQAGGDLLLELHVLSAWLSAAVYRGPLADSAAMVRRSRELLRHVDDPLAEMHLQFRAYHVALGMADLATARERVQSISALAMRLKVPHDALMACLVKKELSWLEGDCSAALAASDEALAIDADEPVYREHVCHRARMEFELGNVEAGQSFLARYLDALRQIGIGKNGDSAIACANLPEVARITGDRNLLDIARAAAKEWIPEGKEKEACEKWGWEQIVVSGLGLTVALQGDKDAAQRLRRALMETRGSSPPWGGSTDRLLARLDMTLGEASEAVAHLEQGVSDCRPLGALNPDLAWMNYEYAVALLARDEAGDRERAAASLEEVLGAARTLGLKPLADRIRSLKGGSL